MRMHHGYIACNRRNARHTYTLAALLFQICCRPADLPSCCCPLHLQVHGGQGEQYCVHACMPRGDKQRSAAGGIVPCCWHSCRTCQAAPPSHPACPLCFPRPALPQAALYSWLGTGVEPL